MVEEFEKKFTSKKYKEVDISNQLQKFLTIKDLVNI